MFPITPKQTLLYLYNFFGVSESHSACHG